MFQRMLFFLLAMGAYFGAIAQEPAYPPLDSAGSHLRISLLTCGPGDEEVYEVFGHTAVRVIDSVLKTDVVFNYGLFEYGPDFEIKFMRGKLLYCVGIETYMDFVREYLEAKRKVEEQVLLLDDPQKESIYAFLQWNAEPENKYYKYDFFFDNCSTRIRDVFNRPDVFGKDFVFGETRQGKNYSFRDIINIYFYKQHWTRLGVNILLGSRIDVKMSNRDIMFLPDYLRDGLTGATVKGKRIATAPVELLPAGQSKEAGINWAMVLTVSLALLTIIGLYVRPLRVLGNIMSSLLLFVTGLLGLLVLVMWFATNHQGCGNNYNLLWALPTNVIIAFFNPKGKGRYAAIALVLIIVSFVVHFLGVQRLIPELVPVLVALMCIYGTIYRKSMKKQLPDARS